MANDRSEFSAVEVREFEARLKAMSDLQAERHGTVILKLSSLEERLVAQSRLADRSIESQNAHIATIASKVDMCNLQAVQLAEKIGTVGQRVEEHGNKVEEMKQRNTENHHKVLGEIRLLFYAVLLLAAVNAPGLYKFMLGIR